MSETPGLTTGVEWKEAATHASQFLCKGPGDVAASPHSPAHEGPHLHAQVCQSGMDRALLRA